MKNTLLITLLIFPFLSSFAQKELWGTVSNGGDNSHGYIFKTDSIGENFEIVHFFDSINGKNPGALLFASNNKLYGLTTSGGINNQGLFSGGVFYEYDLTTSIFNVLEHFGANNTEITGVYPSGDGMRTLVETSPGIILGQIRGAYSGGVVFSYNTTNQTISILSTLPTFQGGGSNTTLGNRLQGTLYKAPDGFLYGTTYTNSQCPIPNPNFGSIVRIDPSNGDFSIRYLCPCSGANGFQFDNNFVTNNNKLFSVTKFGGASNKGVIYSFNPVTSNYTNEYNFQGGLLGFQPSTMVKGFNGKFYGTADGGTPEQGFPSGGGILYEFDPATNQFTKKLDFTYGNGYYMNVGTFPFSLINGLNDKLYGVTPNGVFEYDIAANQTTSRARFPINMGWYSPGTPSLTAVCRKPSYVPFDDTSFTVCSGDFSFDVVSNNTESIIWNHNGVDDLTQLDQELLLQDVNANDSGTWYAQLTNECGTTTSESIHIHLGPEIEVEQTNEILEVTSTGDTFQWIDCATQQAINNETNATFIAMQNGTYAVEVTQNGCTDTSNCFSVSNLYLEELIPTAPVTIYPNPTTDNVSLKFNQLHSSIKIGLMDAVGTELSSQNYYNLDGIVLPVEGAPGIYFIQIETSQGNFMMKILKK